MLPMFSLSHFFFDDVAVAVAVTIDTTITTIFFSGIKESKAKQGKKKKRNYATKTK